MVRALDVHDAWLVYLYVWRSNTSRGVSSTIVIGAGALTRMIRPASTLASSFARAGRKLREFCRLDGPISR